MRALEYFIGLFLIILEAIFQIQTAKNAVWHFEDGDDNVDDLRDNGVEYHEESGFIGFIALNIEFISLLCGDSGEGIKHSGIEKLKEAGLNQNGGVHVCLSAVTFCLGDELNEDGDDKVKDRYHC